MPDEPISYVKLMELWEQVGDMKPDLFFITAKSPLGEFILDNRDGEMDFDGWHHAYIQRDGQTACVPLWEWKES